MSDTPDPRPAAPEARGPEYLTAADPGYLEAVEQVLHQTLPEDVATAWRYNVITALVAEVRRLRAHPAGEPSGELEAADAVRRFTYLLNAMELASQATNPAEQGYAAKRRAVLDFVRDLDRRTPTGGHRA